MLLDLVMPGRGGFDLLAELKRRDNAPPVLVLTATRLEETAKEARALGAADCLRKPFEVEALRRRVRDLVRSGANNSPASAAVRRRAQRASRPSEERLAQPPRQAAGAAALLFQAFSEIGLEALLLAAQLPLARVDVLAVDAVAETVPILGPHFVAAIAPAGHLAERLELGFGLLQRRLRIDALRAPCLRLGLVVGGVAPPAARASAGTPPAARRSSACAGGDRSARAPLRRGTGSDRW